LCTKLVELLLTRWLREKYDNVYLRGRACIGMVRESLFQGENLVLSFSLLFLTLVCRFSCHLLVLQLFLLLDDLLELFFALSFVCHFSCDLLVLRLFLLLDDLLELFFGF
jgi:hypothetical protein